MGYSPWDRKESDMTERLTLSFTFIVFIIKILFGVLVFFLFSFFEHIALTYIPYLIILRSKVFMGFFSSLLYFASLTHGALCVSRTVQF